MEKLATKELTEAVDCVLSLTHAGLQIGKDPKNYANDLAAIMGVIPTLAPAFEGIESIPAELKDLSTEEAAVLVAHVMARLSVGDPKATQVVEKSLKLLAAGFELYKAVVA